MKHEQLRALILKELPALIQEDVAFRKAVLEIAREQFADKSETESRFDRLMDELVQNRQLLQQEMKENRLKWEESYKERNEFREWRKESQKRWDENDRLWKENREQWNKNQEQWNKNQEQWNKNQEQWNKNREQWKESQQRWEDNQRRWEENDKRLEKMMGAIQSLDKKFERKFDQTLGALGTRWGLHSEASFRNGLAAILEEFEGVEVINVNDYDESGVVFGRPDQVELDVIVKNGVLIIGEMKSSVSKSDMYIFERKVRFYEQKYDCKVSRMMVISPMVSDGARPVAERLGIEVYSYADQVAL